MYDEPERKVSLLLWIGIFGLPVPFAFFTLAKGYSNRARMIALGYTALLIIPSLIFGNHDQKSAPVAEQPQAAVSVESASASISPELAAAASASASIEAQKILAHEAVVAEKALSETKLMPNESHDTFNARVTDAYNKFAAAEEAYLGTNWRQLYVQHANQQMIDICEQYTPHREGFWKRMEHSLNGEPSAECRDAAMFTTAPSLEALLLAPDPAANEPTSTYEETPAAYNEADDLDTVRQDGLTDRQAIAGIKRYTEQQEQNQTAQADDQPSQVIIYQSGQ